jgi:hypothetical protein
MAGKARTGNGEAHNSSFFFSLDNCAARIFLLRYSQYKKNPPRPAVPSSLATNANTTSMTIDSLVHSNPSSPVTAQFRVSPIPAAPKLRRLSMQTYFTHRPQQPPSLGNASKQMRRSEVGIFGNGHVMNRI